MIRVNPMIEVLADFHVDRDLGRGPLGPVGARSTARRAIGKASTLRGVRTIAKKHPTAIRIILKGTADALDRANGLSIMWTKDIDLVTHYVPILYEIVKEPPDAA